MLHMNIFFRIFGRSGELSFSEAVDLYSDAEPFPEHIRAAINMYGPVSGMSVIDVGCWTGRLLNTLRGEGANFLVGVDIAGPWLTHAINRFPRQPFMKFLLLVPRRHI